MRASWSYLATAAALAALVLVAATVAVDLTDSTLVRVLAAFAIPITAGLAVTASAAASEATSKATHAQRRTGP
jgi:hypothetical protein